MAAIKSSQVTSTSRASSSLLSADNQLFSSAVKFMTSDDTKITPDGKDVIRHQVLKFVIEPSALKLAQSVFRPGKVYRIRCVRLATLVSAGGGTMNLATQVIPSSFSEYSSLSVLFGECRLVATKIHYNFLTPSGGPNSLFSAFDPSNIGTSPSSATSVAQVPGARILNTWDTVNNPTNSWTVHGQRPWSKVTASATGTDPVGGVLGVWYHSLLTPVSGAVNVADYYIECDYEFRNPQ